MREPRLKRVLMTTDTVGGVWTFALELARGLAEEKIEVVLAALGGRPSAEQSADAKRIPGLCLLGSDFKLEWMENPWADVEASGRWLMQIEKEYSPDLVHLNSFGNGALSWRAPVVLTAHSCVLSWWDAVRGGPAPASWDRYRAEVTWALHAADFVAAPSSAMAESVRRHYGRVCEVIPNGVSPSGFFSAEKEPFVFAAGRLWDEAKNVAALAGIAPLLDWPVCLAGEAGNSQEFGGCRMLGRLSAAEMAGWYSRAAIYALPARYEPFGLSPVEAALSGCALVLGDIPSLREVWGDAARFVPADDPSALKEALDELIGNPFLRAKMSRRAYQRALTFDAADMVRGYLNLYRVAAVKGAGECVS